MIGGGTAAAIAVTIAGGLWLDQAWQPYGQWLVDAFVWGFFLCLWRGQDGAGRRLMALCLGLATFGETVLALAWGLYDYRLGNLPLFVPPGHVLLFLLGLWSARRLPPTVVAATPWLVLPAVLWGLWSGYDRFGLLLYLVFALCLWRGPNRPLYAAMYLLSLGMEIVGTYLGNWAWAPEVPLLGLSNTNPPLSAGAFYCLLDLLVIGLGGLWAAGRPSIALVATNGYKPAWLRSIRDTRGWFNSPMPPGEPGRLETEPNFNGDRP